MSASTWTVRFASGEELSALSNHDLKEFAQSGQLQPTDLVWREGMKDWAKAKKLKGLFPADQPQQAQAMAQAVAPRKESKPVGPVAVTAPSQPAEPVALQRTSKRKAARTERSKSTNPLDKVAVVKSRWPYRGVLLLGLIFICLPWMSFSYNSTAQSFTIGDESVDMPAVNMDKAILGVETDPGIIAFLGGLLAIGISIVNRWVPSVWAKLGIGLFAPCLFFGCWLYFFLKLSEHKMVSGVSMSTGSQSFDFSVGIGSWLFLVSTIALALVTVATQWERKKSVIVEGQN